MKKSILLLFLVLGGALGCSIDKKEKVPLCDGCACGEGYAGYAGCMPPNLVPEKALPIENLSQLKWNTDGGGDLHFDLKLAEASSPYYFLVTVTQKDFKVLSEPKTLFLCSKSESLNYNNPDHNLCNLLDQLFSGNLWYLEQPQENRNLLPTGSWTTVTLEREDQTQVTLHLSDVEIYTRYEGRLDIFQLLYQKVSNSVRASQ